MADNIVGEHVQGVSDEGNPVEDCYPVVIAFEDAAGNKEVPSADAPLPVTVVSGSGGAITVADCADVTQGCIADAAVTGDNAGTVSAKLRGLNKILFDVWDSVNHWFRVSVSNFPATQPVSGTVTANQGAQNAGGAAAWPVQGAQAAGAAIAQAPSLIAGEQAGNVKLLHLSALGSVVADQGIQGGGGTASWQVQGAAASGAALAGNPHLLGVSDGTNVQALKQVTTVATVQFTGFPGAALMLAAGGTTVAPAQAATASVDGSGGGQMLQVAMSALITGTTLDRLRTPKTFKSAQATASGNTAVWTPAASRKFRLMRFYLEMTENVIRAVAGVVTITFQDATTDLGIAFDVWVPAAALTTAGNEWQSGWIDLGNGILSAAQNNVLNVNLSAALTGGNLRVFVCGTEEV